MALESYAVFIRATLTWPLDIIAWPFYRGAVKFLWQSQCPTESETGWAWLPPGFLWALQLCSWIAMREQQSFHGTSLICKSLNRWPATPSKSVSVVHRPDSPSVRLILTGEAAIQFSIATKKMYQPASYLIRFLSWRHCWKHLLWGIL